MSKNLSQSKPTTKELYAMPKTKTQTPNRFEILGKIPKTSTSSSSCLFYDTNEEKQMIQILEADHLSTPREFNFQKKILER